MTGLIEFLDSLESDTNFTTHDGVLFLVFAFCREYGAASGDSSLVDTNALLDFLARMLRRPAGRIERWSQHYEHLARITSNFTDFSAFLKPEDALFNDAPVLESTQPPAPSTPVPETHPDVAPVPPIRRAPGKAQGGSLF